MDAIVRLLLTNACAAGLLAVLAFAVSHVVRRPAIVHGLWLLALVKLVTPPVLPLPLLPGFEDLPSLGSPGAPTVVRMTAEASPVTAVGTPRVRTPGIAAPAPTRPSAVSLPLVTAAGPAQPPAPVPTPFGSSLASHAPGLVRTALGTGALAVLLLAGWRFARFRRLLACAQAAPEAIATRASLLAGRLGLKHVPPILVVPARIPPMLWPEPGGPRLLLPRDLLPQLALAERDALVAHELAHLHRRDHWVRLVEMAATALFWWYPVTWWARRALRRAEERCCDEWVLRVLPRSAEAYAQGLLKSLTFVSAAPAEHPALASGASPLHDLELRLKEILMSRPAPHLAAPLRLALATVAALGLAVFPTHARTSGPDEPAAATAPSVQAITEGAPRNEAERRALEEQRRALGEEWRKLRQQELELHRQELELQARTEQAELRAESERLRAAGKADAAARVARQLELQARRLDLQRSQLGLEAERMALEAKLEAGLRAHQDRLAALEASGGGAAAEDARGAMERAEEAREQAEQELARKQEAIELAAAAAEKQAQALAAEEQLFHVRKVSEELARSLTEQAAALRKAFQETGARPEELERELKRMEAAIEALRADAQPSAPPRKAPRPRSQPQPQPQPQP